MKKSYYGLEPVDLKLILLRIRKRLWLFFTILLLGAILGGLIYGLQFARVNKLPIYQVTADYQITYAEEAPGVPYVFYSEYSWNTIISTEEFTQSVIDKVQELYGKTLYREELLQYYSQVPMSDVRIVSIQTKTNDKELTSAISLGVEMAMLTLADEWKDVEQIKILSSSEDIQKRYLDSYYIQAMLVGGGISILLFGIFYILYLLLDSSIFVSKTFELRYQIPVYGMIPKIATFLSADFQKSIEYQILKAHLNQLASCNGAIYFAGVTDISETEILYSFQNDLKINLFAPVTEHIEILHQIREEDRIVLLIPYGKAKGQAIERTLELIQSMGKTIQGAILVDVDSVFMRQYYGADHTFRNSEKGASL